MWLSTWTFGILTGSRCLLRCQAWDWGLQQALCMDVCVRVAPQLWCGYGQSLDLRFSISKIGLSLLGTWAATSHIDPSRIAALDEPFVGVTSVKTDHSNPSEAFLPHAKKKKAVWGFVADQGLVKEHSHMNGNPFLPEAPYHEHGSSHQILTWPNDRFHGVNTAQVLSPESFVSFLRGALS